MALSLSTPVRNARLDAITTLVGTGGLINIYGGTRPNTGGTATTLLAQLTVSGAFAAAASNAVLTVNTVTQDSSANNSGTATWFRVTTSAGVFIMDGDVGLAGTAADMIITNDVIAAGGVVTVTSFAITDPNA